MSAAPDQRCCERQGASGSESLVPAMELTRDAEHHAGLAAYLLMRLARTVAAAAPAAQMTSRHSAQAAATAALHRLQFDSILCNQSAIKLSGSSGGDDRCKCSDGQPRIGGARHCSAAVRCSSRPACSWAPSTTASITSRCWRTPRTRAQQQLHMHEQHSCVP
jgi:hypothetical protein